MNIISTVNKFIHKHVCTLSVDVKLYYEELMSGQNVSAKRMEVYVKD